MKKWLYFIAPVLGIGVFLFFYFSHIEEAEKAMKIKAEKSAMVAKEEAAKKSALEDRARKDAEAKAKQRADEDAAKEAEKIANWNRQGKEIKDATDEAIGKSSNHTARIVALEKELTETRRKKEAANRESLEISKRIEQNKVDRRSAELEIQRLTDLVAHKAEDSALAAPPPLPPPPPAK
jgi:hypothetical protein